MAAHNFTVVLPQGQAVPYPQPSLLALARQLQADFPDFNNQPVLVHDHRFGHKLYYARYDFEKYVDGKLPLQELIDSYWCHGLYRNMMTLMAEGREEVDAGHLWLLRDNMLVLLDEDRHITGQLNTAPQLFEKIV